MSNNNAPLFYGALPMVKQAKGGRNRGGKPATSQAPAAPAPPVNPVPPVNPTPPAPKFGFRDAMDWLHNNPYAAQHFDAMNKHYTDQMKMLKERYGMSPSQAKRFAAYDAENMFKNMKPTKPVELSTINGVKADLGKMGRGIKRWGGRNKLGLALGALGALGIGASYAGYKARPGLDAIGNGLDAFRRGLNGGAPQQPAAPTPQAPAEQPQAMTQREPLNPYNTQQYDVGSAIKRIANGYGPYA